MPTDTIATTSCTMRPTVSDEVKRLFAIYRQCTGVEPMAGGAHNLIRLAHNVAEPVDLFDAPPPKGHTRWRLDTLPAVVLGLILEYIDVDDLCATALVSRACYMASTHERLWRRLLVRQLTCAWPRVYHNRNPDQLAAQYADMTTKQICLRCDPRRYHLPTSSKDIATAITSHFWSHHLRSLLALQRPRVLMFGPGLETDASRIVRRMLNDDIVHDIRHADTATTPFKVLGMMAGEVSGMGSGIQMCLDQRYFNLITLYSNTKSTRQRLNGDSRVQHNKLFVSDSNSMMELSPQVRQLCKRSRAFVFVVDAYATVLEVTTYRAELLAMLCNLWSPNDAVLLVLVCDGSTTAPTTTKLRPIDVVRALRMGRVNRRWIVQAANVHTLSGVREGFHWLTHTIDI